MIGLDINDFVCSIHEGSCNQLYIDSSGGKYCQGSLTMNGYTCNFICMYFYCIVYFIGKSILNILYNNTTQEYFV